MTPPAVTLVGPGIWQVEIEGRREVVHVAESASGRWAVCRGLVVVEPLAPEPAKPAARRAAGIQAALHAPMPARILQILTAPGARVRAGETLVIVEAMKMELPLRAEADATIAAVHGHEGQLVSPDTVLVEFREEPEP